MKDPNCKPLRIVIAAAGPSERWNNAMGIPKHLVTVGGVPLIHRTQDQFDLGDRSNQILLSEDPRYERPSFQLIKPPIRRTDTILPNTAIGHSEPYWSRTFTTILLFGDVCFGDAARAVILDRARSISDYAFIGRFDARETKPHRELFGLMMLPNQIGKIINACVKVDKWRTKHPPHDVGGWFVFLSLQGFPFDFGVLNNLAVYETPNFINIDDDTDDFDYPEEYERWKATHTP